MGLVPGRFPCPDAPNVYLVRGWPEKPMGLGLLGFRVWQDSVMGLHGLGSGVGRWVARDSSPPCGNKARASQRFAARFDMKGQDFGEVKAVLVAGSVGFRVLGCGLRVSSMLFSAEGFG